MITERQVHSTEAPYHVHPQWNEREPDIWLGGNVLGWIAGRAQSFALLDAYLAAGGNFIDTADSYMNCFS